MLESDIQHIEGLDVSSVRNESFQGVKFSFCKTLTKMEQLPPINEAYPIPKQPYLEIVLKTRDDALQYEMKLITKH